MYSNPGSWHSLLSSLHFYTPPSLAPRILGSRQGECGAVFILSWEMFAPREKGNEHIDHTDSAVKSALKQSINIFESLPNQPSYCHFYCDISYCFHSTEIWLRVMNTKRLICLKYVKICMTEKLWDLCYPIISLLLRIYCAFSVIYSSWCNQFSNSILFNRVFKYCTLYFIVHVI